jgi:hypothetical protein
MLEASLRAAQRLRAVLLRGQSREETHEGFEGDGLYAIATVPTLEDARAPRAKRDAAHSRTCRSGSGASTSG